MYTRQEFLLWKTCPETVGGRGEWVELEYFPTQVTEEEMQLEKALFQKLFQRNPKLHQFRRRRKGTECVTYNYGCYTQRIIRWRLVVTAPIELVRMAVTLTSTKDYPLWDVFSFKNAKYLLHKVNLS
jgi:hypothetical protein